MPWFKRKTAAGRARLENEHGHVLHDESDKPVEFDDPEAQPVEATVVEPAADAGELERLRAENARLTSEATARAEADRTAGTARAKAEAGALADRLAAAGKIMPAQKAAVARAYEAAALADPAEAAAFAKAYEDAPPLGLLGDRTAPAGGPPPGDGTPPAGTLPQGETPPDPIKAKGLDRESLRAVIARGPDGPALLQKLDSGALSWEAVEATARTLAAG